MTSPKQISLFTEEQLMCLQVDSLVSRTVKQENGLEKKMNATSGRKCLEQFERFSRVGLWAKTFAGLLLGTEGWYSTRCRLTWKLRATKYSRFYFQLQGSTLPTKDTEYGLLPTPIAVDVHHAERVKNLKKSGGKTMASRKNGASRPNGLTDFMDFYGLLPTPQAIDGSGPGRELRLKKDCNRDPNQQGSWRGDLKDYATMGMLPTPATRDWKGARSTEALEASGRNETNSLPDYFHQTGKSSQLNPRFVAEMMGFPPNWLELPFLITEMNQSNDTEMQ